VADALCSQVRKIGARWREHATSITGCEHRAFPVKLTPNSPASKLERKRLVITALRWFQTNIFELGRHQLTPAESQGCDSLCTRYEEPVSHSECPRVGAIFFVLGFVAVAQVDPLTGLDDYLARSERIIPAISSTMEA
jgi:hypothetical protein